jgi:hypothetical protein
MSAYAIEGIYASIVKSVVQNLGRQNICPAKSCPPSWFVGVEVTSIKPCEVLSKRYGSKRRVRGMPVRGSQGIDLR